MCLLTETRALSAQGEKRALVGNLTMPWRELRAHGKVKDGHVDRSTFWIEREDRIKFRTKPGVDPWQYVQTWLNACDPG